LWITNREKLWKFVEEELFPAWGVKDHTVFYWLKVKPDGSLIGNLDLLHHRPYECLLVGYINLNKEAVRGSKFKFLEERRVIMSVPGAHSRKPPLQSILVCSLSVSMLFIIYNCCNEILLCYYVNMAFFIVGNIIYDQDQPLTCKRITFRIYTRS
jgi:hypothetical protein